MFKSEYVIIYVCILVITLNSYHCSFYGYIWIALSNLLSLCTSELIHRWRSFVEQEQSNTSSKLSTTDRDESL